MSSANKVAIVTASDSGIGKKCAVFLAKQGFDIGITWHSDDKGAKETAQEVESLGRRAELIQLNLSHLPEGANAIQTLIDRFGRIDALVNNAGAMIKKPFLEMTFDEWRSIQTVGGCIASIIISNSWYGWRWRWALCCCCAGCGVNAAAERIKPSV